MCEGIEHLLDDAAIRAAQPPARDAKSGDLSSAARAPRWTIKRLLVWAGEHLGLACCRETLRKTLHAMDMSWKKGKRLLARANPEARIAFVSSLKRMLRAARAGDETLVFIDEAHVHQDADLGRTWSRRGKRFFVSSSSPGLAARVTFFGAYVYTHARVHVWPAECGNGQTTVEALECLRAAYPKERIRVIWDGAPYHRAGRVYADAKRLNIKIVRLPAYSPDLMPVEPLWRWLREEVTYNHCHNDAEELITAVDAFEHAVNAQPQTLVDRLRPKTRLEPEEEKLRIS